MYSSEANVYLHTYENTATCFDYIRAIISLYSQL